jgi:hypothetical protein
VGSRMNDDLMNPTHTKRSSLEALGRPAPYQSTWSRCFRSWRFMVVLIVLQVATLFPFRFTDEFGERDSYRMFLGLVDSLKTGTLFNSSLLYNREASFGYYGFLYALAPIIGNTPLGLISTMNWVGFLSVVLFAIPEYIVTERLFGGQVAAASGLILIATPVWWYCGLYAHPITTSLLLFFSGLAILCHHHHPPPVWIRITALGFFAAALIFRFDVVLLLIVLVAVLWEVRQMPIRDVAKESAFYIVGSVALFGAAQQFLPPVNHGDAPPSILILLARFHNPSHIASSVRDSIIMLGQGFTPLPFLAVPISMWMLYRKSRYPALLFVSGVIAINLMFWLPNPSPARHYLMMAPAMSISTAFVLEAFLSHRPRLRSSSGVIAGIAAAISIVGANMALSHGKGYLAYFPSQFEKRLGMKADIAQANRIAEGLVRLPPLATPVVVLCDSNLVIAEMVKLAADTSAVHRTAYAGMRPIALHDVRQGKNQFLMVEQSWDETVIEDFDQSGAYIGLPVLSAPYLPIEYKGTRRLLAIDSRPGMGQGGSVPATLK